MHINVIQMNVLPFTVFPDMIPDFKSVLFGKEWGSVLRSPYTMKEILYVRHGFLSVALADYY